MTHPIIKTDNYILITSDEEIKEGDYHVATRIIETNGDKAIAYTDKSQLKAISEIGGAKKIVAHLPLNNSPILEGVPLLPPLPNEEDDVEKLVNNYVQELVECKSVKESERTWISAICHQSIIKAKEKYKFTEEDVIKIVEKSRETGLTAEYLMLSLSQPKLPVGFKCEISKSVYVSGGLNELNVIGDKGLKHHLEEQPLIINGVMQGEWIFE